MRIRITAVSDKGCIRENNEDMVLVGKKLLRDSQLQGALEVDEQGLHILAVADGIGGQNAGEIASQMVLEQFQEKLSSVAPRLDETSFTSTIAGICRGIHRTLQAASAEDITRRGMGTTLIALLIYSGEFFMVNAGDSRLYRFRNGNLMQLSEDHSLRNISNNPDAPSNVIVNSFGGGDNFFVDVAPASKKVLLGDIFLLCSDGLSDMVSDEEIEEIMGQEGLETRLLDCAKANGGKDNISYVLAEIIDCFNGEKSRD